MPLMKQNDAKVSSAVPAALVERLERVAPVSEGRRSEFIRTALQKALDQAERDQAGHPDPAA
jgi:metal-responsive CopG/Arc/MetJ family transcriptional regulator